MRKIKVFLSSRRLAIFLTLALGGVMFVGTLVPQNAPAKYYKAHYKEWLSNLLVSLGLTDIFKSWYFVAVLILLAVGLVACTARRCGEVFAAFRLQPPNLPFDETEYCQAEIGPAATYKTVIAKLRALPLNWREKGDVFYGRRRPAALFGNVLSHIGLLFILLAAGLGVFGRRGEISIFEGQRVALPPAYGKGFEIRTDAVDEIADANTGKVLSYGTKVSLLRYGDEVAAGELNVKRPMHYRGLAIYQSDMALAEKGLYLEEVHLKEGGLAESYGRAIFSWQVGGESGDVTMAPGEGQSLGRSGFTLRYAEYFERFHASEGSVGDDGADYNPAAFVEIENDKGEIAKGVLFKLYPELSFLRADVSDFIDGTLRIEYSADDGPWRAARLEHLLASGSFIAFGDGGETMKIVMVEGESYDLRERRLEGVIERRDGGEERVEFPFGIRVRVRTNGGESIFRFLGSKEAPVAALTITRGPGLTFFYLACVLFSVGVVTAAALRYDELVAYVKGGRVYLAARSSKGAVVLKPAFDKWVATVKENR